jgi:hypothetical protein
MAYYEVHLLANDQDFMNRAVACAAVEGMDDPLQWATSNRYEIAAAPGFGDKYASALVRETPYPGRDQAVIADPELLASVRAVSSRGKP